MPLLTTLCRVNFRTSLPLPIKNRVSLKGIQMKYLSYLALFAVLAGCSHSAPPVTNSRFPASARVPASAMRDRHDREECAQVVDQTAEIDAAYEHNEMTVAKWQESRAPLFDKFKNLDCSVRKPASAKPLSKACQGLKDASSELDDLLDESKINNREWEQRRYGLYQEYQRMNCGK